MPNIVVVEDQMDIRDATIQRLEPMTKNGWFKLKAIEVSAKLPAEVLAHELTRKLWKPSYSIVVLDLSLGHRSGDGLQAMKYLRHCFDGAVVLHSSQWDDKTVQSEARKLGIRFGTNKLAPNLEELISAASEVSFARSATLGDSLFHSRAPIPDYVPPSGVSDLDEVWLKLKRLGRNFDGSSESVDWEAIPVIQTEIDAHVEAAKEQGNARFYAEHDYDARCSTPHYEFFEDFVINAIPVLSRLEETFRRSVQIAEQYISF